MIQFKLITLQNYARYCLPITLHHSLSAVVGGRLIHLVSVLQSLHLNLSQGVTINSLHPGIVRTDIFRPSFRMTIIKYLVLPFFKVKIVFS